MFSPTWPALPGRVATILTALFHFGNGFPLPGGHGSAFGAP